jgi:hypothetical protein
MFSEAEQILTGALNGKLAFVFSGQGPISGMGTLFMKPFRQAGGLRPPPTGSARDLFSLL